MKTNYWNYSQRNPAITLSKRAWKEAKAFRKVMNCFKSFFEESNSFRDDYNYPDGVTNGSAELFAGIPAPFGGATRIIRGATRVIRGATRVIRGATRVIRGATRIIRGATRNIRGATRIIRGATRNIRGATRVKGGKSANLYAFYSSL